MRAALQALVLVAAAAAPLTARAATDLPATIAMSLPPPVAIHPLADAEPAAATTLWERNFDGEMPSDVVAFAIPDIRAQFNPNRTAKNGEAPVIEVTYAIVGFTPVLVHGRFDACHEARLVEELALARRHAEILNAKAMADIKQDAQRRLKATPLRTGADARGQLSEVLRLAFLKERGVTLGSFRVRTTITAGMLRGVRCGAPIRSRDDIPIPEPAPTRGATPAESSAAAETAPPAPAYTTDEEMQQILLRMQQTRRGR